MNESEPRSQEAEFPWLQRHFGRHSPFVDRHCNKADEVTVSYPANWELESRLAERSWLMTATYSLESLGTRKADKFQNKLVLTLRFYTLKEAV